MPVPLKVMLFAIVKLLPLSANSAPLLTVTGAALVPSAVEFCACTVPAVTVTPWVASPKVFAPERINAPLLFWVMPLVPEMIPLKVLLAVLVLVSNALNVPPPDNVMLAAPPIFVAPPTVKVLPNDVPAEVVSKVPPFSAKLPVPSALLASASNVPVVSVVVPP